MRATRRAAAALLCLVPLAAAGCGSSSSGAKSPLDDALGYLPKSAPFVLAIDTNLGDSQWKSLTANEQKFPFSGQVMNSLKQSLSQAGFDFNKDIKPILGNEAVVGSPTAQGFTGSSTQVVAALKAKDEGKLSSLLSRSKGAKKDGSSNGATLYRDTTGTDELAQKGAMLIIASNKQQLVAALEQRGRSDRLTEAQFDTNMNGLPGSALVRTYLDVQGLINSSPASANATKIKWVAALRTVGVTMSSTSGGIGFDVNARTDPSGLTDADLPVASGAPSPPVSAKPGEIGVGLRGIDQTERFAESVAQAVSPASYGDFLRSKRRLGSRLGVNLDRDLIGQLSGNASIAYDLNGGFALRADPKDPAAFTKTLDRFSKVAPAFAQGAGLPGARLTRANGLYKLTGRNGKTVYYGMVGKVFAVSNSASRLAEVATIPAQAVPGAKGAISLNADAGRLVAGIIQKASGGGLGGALGGSVVSAPLGNLTGWATSSTSGLQAHLQLQIK